MTSLLALLFLSFALPSSPNGTHPAQTFCPPETTRGRALVVAYATGDHGATRPAGVPVKHESQVRLLVDQNSADRLACDRLREVVAAQRRDQPGSTAGFQLTFYAVDGNYYAVALPSTPAVQQTSPGQFRVRLRWTPVFVTDANFRLLVTAAM